MLRNNQNRKWWSTRNPNRLSNRKLSPAGITLAHSELILDRNQWELPAIAATVSPWDANDKSLRWWYTVTDAVAMEVNPTSGAIFTGPTQGSGYTEGTIWAVARDGSNVSSPVCSVKIRPPVASVQIAPTLEFVLGVDGPHAALGVTIQPAIARQEVGWRSADPNVATIDEQTGVITPVGVGSTIIGAYSTDGNGGDIGVVSNNCTVTVRPAPTYFDFDLSGFPAVVIPGVEYPLPGAIVRPDGAAGGHQWEKSDNVTLRFAGNAGWFTAHGAGPHSLTLRSALPGFDHVTGTHDFSAYQPVTGISLTRDETYPFYPGDIMTFRSTVSPSNATYPGITWHRELTNGATIQVLEQTDTTFKIKLLTSGNIEVWAQSASHLHPHIQSNVRYVNMIHPTPTTPTPTRTATPTPTATPTGTATAGSATATPTPTNTTTILNQGVYRLKNRSTGTYLTLTGNSLNLAQNYTFSNNVVMRSSTSGFRNQYWRLDGDSQNGYRIWANELSYADDFLRSDAQGNRVATDYVTNGRRVLNFNSSNAVNVAISNSSSYKFNLVRGSGNIYSVENGSNMLAVNSSGDVRMTPKSMVQNGQWELERVGYKNFTTETITHQKWPKTLADEHWSQRIYNSESYVNQYGLWAYHTLCYDAAIAATFPGSWIPPMQPILPGPAVAVWPDASDSMRWFLMKGGQKKTDLDFNKLLSDLSENLAADEARLYEAARILAVQGQSIRLSNINELNFEVPFARNQNWNLAVGNYRTWKTALVYYQGNSLRLDLTYHFSDFYDWDPDPPIDDWVDFAFSIPIKVLQEMHVYGYAFAKDYDLQTSVQFNNRVVP